MALLFLQQFNKREHCCSATKACKYLRESLAHYRSSYITRKSLLYFLKIKIQQSFKSICSKTSQLFVLQNFPWFVTEIPLAVSLVCSPLSYPYWTQKTAHYLWLHKYSTCIWIIIMFVLVIFLWVYNSSPFDISLFKNLRSFLLLFSGLSLIHSWPSWIRLHQLNVLTSIASLPAVHEAEPLPVICRHCPSSYSPVQFPFATKGMHSQLAFT